MPPTKLKYFKNSYLFEDHAKVLQVINAEGKDFIILDESIFYPKGGGQPFDLGKISKDENIFNVKEVIFNNGWTYHFGNFEKNHFNIGDIVSIHLDEARRRLHARLHTAGHLVDDALFSLGYILNPVKGYHYPDGPYVEYEGNLNEDLPIVAAKIQERIYDLINTDYQVHSEIVNTKKDLEGKCLYLPSHIPEGKPIRIVYVSGPTKGQPCGGTHVKHLKEVGNIKIPKIKAKSGNIRVSYTIE